MNAYHYGTLVRVSVTFQVGGTDTDPTTVTFRHRKPDGTVTAWVYGTDSQVVKDAVGKYHADLALNQEGVWTYRWEGTGAAEVAGEDALRVLPTPFY